MDDPDTDRDVIITLLDGREGVAHHPDWLGPGEFIDDDYNACGCDTCSDASDTRIYRPVSWREINA